mgnify:CR=1 FL=1
MVGARGFEPPASCSRSRRATRLRYAPFRPPGTNPVQGRGQERYLWFMRCRRLVLLIACVASIASSRDAFTVMETDGWAPGDSGQTWEQQISLREGQSATLQLVMQAEGEPNSAAFVDVLVSEQRGEPTLVSAMGWPEHIEVADTTALEPRQWITLQVDDVLRGCASEQDTGWTPPADIEGGLCTATVDVAFTLEGEGNVVLSVNPSLSTPWDNDGAAWIAGFSEF